MTLANRSRVLIAGAGWRVWRFVVPALLNEGVAPERIVILRRSPSAELAPGLRGLRIVTTLDDVSGMDVGLTLNCVSAESLVPVQRALISRWPVAMHACDTPTYSQRGDWQTMIGFTRARLCSLEDWPLMPNLAHFARAARRPGRFLDLRVERFGIPGHFLSLFRTIAGARAAWRADALIQADGDTVGEPRPGARISLHGPKQQELAKVSLRTDQALLEDFHEVTDAPIRDAEVVYRMLDEHGVHYRQGEASLGSYRVERALLDSFRPFDDRRNVHELDKFIGLTHLFRALLDGAGGVAYPYLRSVRDAATARRLQARGRSRLL